MGARAVAVACLCLTACAEETTETVPSGSGGGVSCPAPQRALPDGSCLSVGVPPDGCGSGFAHDGVYGCEPVLPSEPCDAGFMAIPGETECRPVMACGAGTWGDIPTEPNTQYVDDDYAGGDSDGTASKPWTTIEAAIFAAQSGAVIAVAEGVYAVSAVSPKTIRIWGVCPEKTEFSGASFDVAIITLLAGADGSEIHGVSFRGQGVGIGVAGASDVQIDRVWVHNLSTTGIGAIYQDTASSVHVVDSLIEHVGSFGVLVRGSALTFERSIVRSVAPSLSGSYGRGFNIYDCTPQEGCTPTTRGSLDIRSSVVEDTAELGIHIAGSDLTMTATLVRRTAPELSTQTGGRNVNIEMSCEPLGCAREFQSTANVQGSVIEQGSEVGLAIAGSFVTVNDTVVRTTAPEAATQRKGWGIGSQFPCTPAECFPDMATSLEVRRSYIADSHDAALLSLVSDLLLEGTVLARTLPNAQTGENGRGLNIQRCSRPNDCNAVLDRTVTVGDVLIEQSSAIGVFIADSQASVARTIVDTTAAQASDGLFGDGIIVARLFESPTTLTLENSIVSRSARAGMMLHQANASLAQVRIQCALLDFALEGGSSMSDAGDNLCGCPNPGTPCHATSAGLTPPEPLDTDM
ncbi:MAG TPA: right-handed parallel beta-helix repeat-containing protein [Polyangiaceae bacterium]|nr:right-handed parallel beta-helix repeat-containing protein [Polyangiaceae bacterium]